MATFTRREMIDQAAFKLGALATGQTLSAEDLAALDTITTMLLDQLAEDEIVFIADDSEIPASWVPYIAGLLANLAAPDYGGSFSGDTKNRLEYVLRKLVRGKETYEEQTPDYF